MKSNKMTQQKADLKTVSNFNEVAKANVIHKPNTNVSEPIVNVLQSTKKDYSTKVAKKEKSLSYRVALLKDEANSIEGKAFLNAANLTIDDLTVPNVLGCFTSIVVNGKSHFCKIVKLNSDNVLNFATLEILSGAKIENVDFKFSILDKNYLSSTKNNEILILKGDSKFTLQIVESLSFNTVLSKLAAYKKEKVRLKTKAFLDKQKAENEALKPKKVNVDITKMSKEEVLAYVASLEKVA